MNTNEIYSLFNSIIPQLESLEGKSPQQVFIIDEINYSQEGGIISYVKNILNIDSSTNIFIPNFIISCPGGLYANFLTSPTGFQYTVDEIISFSNFRFNQNNSREVKALGELILLLSNNKIHLIKNLFRVKQVVNHVGIKPRFISYVLESISDNASHTFDKW